MSAPGSSRHEPAGSPAAGPRGAVPSGERLFRRRALERYARRDEESVLPRLARPPVFAALWVLLALLAVLAGVVGALPVADERTVPLVIAADGPRLVLPPEELFSSGDSVRFILAGATRHGRVGAVGEAMSPAELRSRLGDVGPGLTVDGPRRLATIEMAGSEDPLDGEASRGAVVEARVTVDRPRAATLLPGVGPWIARRLADRDPGPETSP